MKNIIQHFFFLNFIFLKSQTKTKKLRIKTTKQKNPLKPPETWQNTSFTKGIVTSD